MDGIWEAVRGWFGENLSDFTTSKMYLACAIAGGTVILSQLGLNLFGLGGDGDVDPDVDVDDIDGGEGMHFLSVRALSAFLIFFGLVGNAGVQEGWSTPVHTLTAFGAGSSVMVMVAFIMRFFIRMQSSGTIDAHGAVGMTAQVYLRIPAERSGKGKIQVMLQGRTAEFQAVTTGEAIPTGAACVIQKQVTSDTFEVLLAE
ncbi:MAG: hypothetical protein ACI8QS_000747 [Planctomycetota bacterium]|jgi:hypothetical protein